MNNEAFTVCLSVVVLCCCVTSKHPEKTGQQWHSLTQCGLLLIWPVHVSLCPTLARGLPSLMNSHFCPFVLYYVLLLFSRSVVLHVVQVREKNICLHVNECCNTQMGSEQVHQTHFIHACLVCSILVKAEVMSRCPSICNAVSNKDSLHATHPDKHGGWLWDSCAQLDGYWQFSVVSRAHCEQVHWNPLFFFCLHRILISPRSVKNHSAFYIW